jgi:hypothetical protein
MLMSLLEKNKVDALGIDEKGNLLMLIIDEVNWKDKREHLICLQDKINNYVAFIETKQYRQTYPSKNFDEFIIRISFLYKIPKKCVKFLNEVNKQLNSYSIFVEYEVENE